MVPVGTSHEVEDRQVFETVEKETSPRRVLGAWALPMSNPETEGIAKAVPVRCPKCGELSTGCGQLRLADLLRRLVGTHPWRCPVCSLRFYLKRSR